MSVTRGSGSFKTVYVCDLFSGIKGFVEQSFSRAINFLINIKFSHTAWVGRNTLSRSYCNYTDEYELSNKVLNRELNAQLLVTSQNTFLAVPL